LRRDKEIIKEAKKEIEHFKDEVDKDDTMNLYYFDESSFSLSPNIPYGWDGLLKMKPLCLKLHVLNL